jgi:hypothetical protein
MNDLTAPIANKIGKLIRLLSSTKDGEVVAAAHALVRTLEANKLDIHALAQRIEAGGGFDEDLAHAAYSDGFKAGMRTAAAQRQQGSASGPQVDWWVKMARACQRQPDRLSERQEDFVNQMARRTFEPTEKQARWLRGIFNKLGED